MTSDQRGKIESLAREAIRCAISTHTGDVSTERAREAFAEFQRVVGDPALLLDLIREWKAATREPLTQ